MNSAVPFPAFASAVDAPEPIPNVKTLKECHISTLYREKHYTYLELDTFLFTSLMQAPVLLTEPSVSTNT